MNWEQFRAIIWLRWRLTKNQFAKGGQVNAVLGILIALILGIGAVGAGFGGLMGGVAAGARVPSQVLMLICDGILFVFLIFWLTGLMIEIQRSESIDLSKLLHLPVSLQQVFVFNYLASHMCSSVVLMLPGILGFCVGLAVGGGPMMILLAPLALSFIFVITAWTYCLRGWLAALMVNKRRRRAIVVWISIGVALLGQLPNLVINSHVFRKHEQASKQAVVQGVNGGDRKILPENIVQGHLVIPAGWVGYGAMTLKEHQIWPAVGGTALCGLLGALGLIRAYRMTLRFYQGAEGQGKARAVRVAVSPQRGPLLVERKLPWLPDDIAGLTLATFRSLVRAPELKMACLMPLVFGIILMTMYLSRGSIAKAAAWKDFAGSALVALTALSLSPAMANMFGLDRNGFRALVLLPTRRHCILFAKNLAGFPLFCLISGGMLIILQLLVPQSFSAVITVLLQIPAAFLLFSLLYNLTSIYAPCRLAQGSLQVKKPKPIVMLVSAVSMIFVMLILVPLSIPTGLQLLFTKLGWLPWLPVNVLGACIVLAIAIVIYKFFLPIEGRLLQRREQTILREVTEDIE